VSSFPWNIVAHVNLTGKPQARKPQAHVRRRLHRQQFFFVVDSGANTTVAGSAAARARVRDVRPAGENDVIMMNSHPARITGYGTLDAEFQDAATEEWFLVALENVAVCPDSDYDLLGWSAYADGVARRTGSEPPPMLTFTHEAQLPVTHGAAGELKYITAKRHNGMFSFRARSPRSQSAVLATLSPALPLWGRLPPLASAAPSVLPGTKKEVMEEEEKSSGAGVREKKSSRKSDNAASGPPELEKKMSHQRLQHGEVVLARAREVLRMLHARTGHVLKVGSLQRMIRAGGTRVVGLENAEVKRAIMTMRPEELECLPCAEAATNKLHPNKHKTAKAPGQWTIDVSGKYWWTRSGERYVLVVVAPEGKGVFSAFLRHKSEVPDALRVNRKKWERLVGEAIQTLRMDRAGEQTGEKMKKFAEASGISLSFTSPDSSAGPAEAYIHILQDSMKSMLNDYARLHKTKLPTHLWVFAWRYGMLCKDALWCTTNGGTSMYEKRTGKKPDLRLFHVWGSTVTTHQHAAKGENTGRVARFLGFAAEGDGYVLLDPKKGTIFHAKTVHPFDLAASKGESVEAGENGESRKLVTNRSLTPPFVHPNPFSSLAPAPGEEEAPQPGVRRQEAPPQEEKKVEAEPDGGREVRARETTQRINLGHDEWQTLATTRPGFSPSHWQGRDVVVTRLQDKGAWLQGKAKATRNYLRARRGKQNVGLPSGGIPESLREALTSEDRLYWIAAIKEERQGLEEKGVFSKASTAEEEKEAERARPISSRYHFDIKLRAPSCQKTGPTYVTLPDGRKVRYKARLVARGFTQLESVDFNIDQTYAPTPQIASIRLVLAQTLGLGWELAQLDVRQAFLVAELPEEEQMHMRLPGGEGLVKLLRSLYGLRQSAHHWHREIKGTLLKHGFTCVDADQGVYTLYDTNGKLRCALALHVDDCLISAPSALLEETVTKLKAAYDSERAPADWFLKMSIKRSADGRSLSISQKDFAADIVRAFGLDIKTTNPAKTPMDAPLLKGADPITVEEEREMATLSATYGTVVGMLSYLCNGTRPDLAYAVNQVQSFTSAPRLHHWRALKRIVRYLIGTVDYGLVYTADDKPIRLWCDADFAADTENRRSMAGFVSVYANAAISWKAVKIKSVSRSTGEAELKALDLAARDGLWLRKMASALTMPNCETLTIFEDNSTAFSIANGSGWSPNTKHVDVQYYAVREDVDEKRIKVDAVASADNIADIFTKPLKPVLFCRFREGMGVRKIE
jgi:hypothetical protein